MTQPNQSALQGAIREQTNTALTFEGDWHALFTLDGIATGTFNERLLAWINFQLNTTYNNLVDAQAAYAAATGVSRWTDIRSPFLGPNLFPPDPLVTFGAPNWTYAAGAFTKANSTGAWGGVNDVYPAGTKTFELSVTVSGSNSGGTVTPALVDNATSGNNSPFSTIAGNLANGTYVGRATANASNQALAFFSGTWQGTITINYLKLVL